MTDDGGADDRDHSGTETSGNDGGEPSGNDGGEPSGNDGGEPSGNDGGEPPRNARGEAADGEELTHVDGTGDVQMVDVGQKADSARRAVAAGEIRLRESTVAAIRADGVRKGDVLTTARIGAVQAVKHTWETVPMCHQIPVTNVETDFTVEDDRVVLEVTVETTGKTGCEMEALQGVTTGLGTVWDMVKAAEKNPQGQYPDTRITNVRVIEKTKREIA